MLALRMSIEQGISIAVLLKCLKSINPVLNFEI